MKSQHAHGGGRQVAAETSHLQAHFGILIRTVLAREARAPVAAQVAVPPRVAA
ncbi:hypothetical protein [Hymenobacter sp. UV11]|uniref:hypothetical protein n=1 Tax=Hymenobacter sp. UV11 TaxID=1849735 RepID=UPI00141521D0|nr:hypothetical protein [Hymenobacter sp. UV11]